MTNINIADSFTQAYADSWGYVQKLTAPKIKH